MMIGVLPWMIKYKKHIGLALAMAGLILIYNIHKHSLINQGYAKAMIECEYQKQDIINENIKIKRKQDSVIPFADKRELIDGLRNGQAL